jgi:hypothetical protein
MIWLFPRSYRFRYFCRKELVVEPRPPVKGRRVATPVGRRLRRAQSSRSCRAVVDRDIKDGSPGGSLYHSAQGNVEAEQLYNRCRSHAALLTPR